ncbi:MAG: endonuclease/exonuclease/phosphatase family protein [Bacteroidota bacterium]
MRYRSIIIGCFLCVSLGCGNKLMPGSASPSGGAIHQLRILTYNIHHANPPSKPGVIDIAAIANVIKQQQPDLVALQEVDVYTSRSGKTVNEAEEIAKQSGMPYYFFAKAIDYGGGEYGVAILSRYPIEKTTNDALPTEETTNGEHRTLATVTAILPGQKKIMFACTHLDAQGKDTNRFLQIKKIAMLLETKEYPLIIAGDFNDIPGSRVMNELDKYFTRSCTNCAFTIPQINPNQTIDHIAYRPSSGFAVMKHSVIDEKYASDHLPVLAVLKIK